MRDPKRIDAVLGELAKYWKRYPDLRLCQIVGNFLFDENDAKPAMDSRGYNTEDDTLLEYLRGRNKGTP